MTQPILILVAGPSASGKSTLTGNLARHLEDQNKSVTVIALDNYYRDIRHLSLTERARQNFDEPDAWEHERILEDARQLKCGKTINIPVYDFTTHLRTDQTHCIHPTDIVIMEGLFALCYSELNAMADLKIYVALDDATALERRIRRDTLERGRTRASVVAQYEATVQPANVRHINPSSRHADALISGNLPFRRQLKAIAPRLQ